MEKKTQEELLHKPKLILKFGGTSVANADSIRRLGEIVQSTQEEVQGRIAVVVSAFGKDSNHPVKVTDQLIACASLAKENQLERVHEKIQELRSRHQIMIEQLLEAPEQKEMLAQEREQLLEELHRYVLGVSLVQELSLSVRDKILSIGERLSAKTIAAFLSETNASPWDNLDTSETVVTDERFAEANVLADETFSKTRAWFNHRVNSVVVTGFIGATRDGRRTTLGRGGSDLTPTLLAAALKVEEVRIYSDACMMTTDPRIVPEARQIQHISRESAARLSRKGAGIVYHRAFNPARYGYPETLHLLNTFHPHDPGTVIHMQKEPEVTNGPVSGLASLREATLFTIEDPSIQRVPGSAAKLFTKIADEGINLSFVSLDSSELEISFATREEDAPKVEEIIELMFQESKMSRDDHASLVSVVGDHMKERIGLANKVFATLAQEDINAIAFTQGGSENCISIVVPRKDHDKALQALHHTFFNRSES